ncbi:flavodoxin [Tsuneonella sp. HG222]
MTTPSDLSRRTLLAMPAILTMTAGAAACAQPASIAAGGSSRLLVAFFTRSGNTRVIAGTIQRALNANLFEIQPARPYPADYEETVAQAEGERDRGYEPPLAAAVPNLRSYESIFLGFPIWGETAPPIIRSFLRAHDLSGRTLRPFITHGGYGLGNSLAVLAEHAPGVRIEAPFVMEADQERRTLTQVRGWLDQVDLL